MARCHRIGQKKEVTIYRLITKDTYEEQLWKTSTIKQGLDEAVLGNSGPEDPGGYIHMPSALLSQ